MKNEIIELLDDYKKKYPEELKKLLLLDEYLKNNQNVIDWNNFNGYITVGTFVYKKNIDSILLVFHNDFKIYLHPGGHVETTDKTLKSAALRELKEATNLEKFVKTTELIDIDIHDIPENKALNLPTHKHFDFRFLAVVDDIDSIKIEESELSGYKWVTREEFKTLTYLGDIVKKIDKVLNKMD